MNHLHLKLLLALFWLSSMAAAQPLPTAPQPDYKTIKTDWQARWIGEATPSKPNAWQRFRKEVDLAAVPASAVAYISCDSKYWLWVNGRLVVFEGQLKRGPTPRDTYFDAVELAPYLRAGRNTVAMLVWYWGKEGFAHKSSGKLGLLFEMPSGPAPVLSDATWRTAPHPAFGATGAPHPNYRLAESNVHYDAQLGNEDWIQPNFDARAWPAATELAAAGAAPWGQLWQRPFKLWHDSGLLPYASPVPAVADGQPVTMKLPRNLTVTPYFKIDAPAGLLIDLRTDNYKGGSAFNLRSEYVTRAGVQEFETPAYMNGHEVIYTFPKGVKILDLKYRDTRFDAGYVGSFTSSDAALDTLWRKALYTMNVNMRDAIQDPDRERAQWWGDAVIILEEIFYSADVATQAAIRKSLSNLLEWQKPDGVLFSPIPAGNWDKELPAQMLASVGKFGLGQYVRHSGDTAFVRYAYPAVQRYMALWQTHPNGLVVHRKGGWDWHDWGDKIDVPVLDNAWYYLALEAQRDMARQLGRAAEAQAINGKMQRLKTAFQATFWQKNRFVSADFKPYADDRAQGLAVAAGLADARQWQALRPVLDTTLRAGPYLEKYILEAYFRMGDADAGLARMKSRYQKMIDSPISTLWEGWDIGSATFGGGTYNHGWSGGPLSLLSGYVAGIQPLEAGYASYQIKPQLGSLTRASAHVQTMRGDLTVAASRTAQQYTLRVQSALPGRGIIYVPKPLASSKRLLLNGEPLKMSKKIKRGNGPVVRVSQQADAFVVETLGPLNGTFVCQ